jgi:hypothetical protein
MKRLVLWFFATLFFGGVALSPALFIYLYNEQPPIVYSQRKVLTPTVAPGDTLRIRISADVNKRCDATVYRTIVDSVGKPTEFVGEPRPHKTDYIVEIKVPRGAEPGPAYYSARLLWVCNVVQQWFPQEVIQRQIDFNIAPAEGQMPMPDQQGIYNAPIRKSDYARIQGY